MSKTKIVPLRRLAVTLRHLFESGCFWKDFGQVKPEGVCHIFMPIWTVKCTLCICSCVCYGVFFPHFLIDFSEASLFKYKPILVFT